MNRSYSHLRRKHFWEIFLVCFLVGIPLGMNLDAEVSLPDIFGEHMVLQQGNTLPIWGKAASGEKVTVCFAGQVAQTFAAENGSWRVTLRPVAVTDSPQTLLIEGKNRIEIQDVLVGDVWMAAGDENMQFPMAEAVGGKDPQGEKTDTSLRFFTFGDPESLLNDHHAAGWRICKSDDIQAISAVGYFFARDLRSVTHLPIGMIQCTASDAPIQAWISREGHLAPPSITHFINPSENHSMAFKASSSVFQKLIAPLIPYALSGVIWYHGESEEGRDALEYRRLFPRLIRDWRKHWGQGPFPFYFVLPAGFGEVGGTVVESFFDNNHHPQRAIPWLREGMESALTLPFTGMAVAVDLGISDDPQPSDKLDVGRRLARLARKRVYGEEIIDVGPSFESKRIEGAKLRIVFNHVGSGLSIASSPVQPEERNFSVQTHLTGFALAGVDGKWHPATGVIDGMSVLLRSDAVPHPLEARYNWKGFPAGNLYNHEGLPVPPFRTDADQPK